mgnify:CR=1 FL=1
MCGEKAFSKETNKQGVGSPPRVRGKDPLYEYNNFTDRITPACAGKRREFVFCRAAFEDHPRVCGEKDRGNNLKEGKMGSPPRVRGKAAPD